MTTPWDRVDDDYRRWLLDTPIAADEFNTVSLTERRSLRSLYLTEQQQQRQRPPRHPNVSMEEDMHALLKSMEAMTLAVAKGRTTVHGSCSSETRAKIVEGNIALDKDFVPDDKKASVVTADEAVELAGLRDEKKSVAFLLAKIEACFTESNLVVVDSQDFPWLPQFSGQETRDRMRPDGFVTHSSLYTPRSESARQVLAGTRAPRNGTPADDGLLATEVYIVEGKRGLSLRGQLELVDYMNVISDDSSRGIVIGKDGFWLIKAQRWTIQQRIKAKWTDGGTKDLLATFFKPSKLSLAVDKVCYGLGCKIAVEPGRPSFLGAGGYGHAFRVHKNDEDTEKALKVAIGHRDMIAAEFEILRSIGASSLPVVKVEGIFKDYKESYSGYLMSQVGRPIEQLDRTNRRTTTKTVEDLFNSLRQLHDAGYAHGDPRLENAIRYENSLLWIDFMNLFAGVACNESSKKLDFVVLSMSIFRHAGISVTAEEVDELVSRCDVNDTTQVIHAVLDNVFNNNADSLIPGLEAAAIEGPSARLMPDTTRQCEKIRYTRMIKNRVEP